MNATNSFLEKTQNPRLYQEISKLFLFINSGDSFSTAMKKLPQTFDRREIAIIEAGEASGSIQKSFMNLSKQLREQEELRKKISGALTYPLIIMVFLAIAITVIMTYVIPKIQPLFASNNVELPAITQSLISTSDFMVNNFVLLLILVIGCIFAIQAYVKTDSGRMFFHEMALKVPLIGDVYRNYLLARIASNLGILLGAGIPILRTFALTAESSNNAVYGSAISEAIERITQGKKIVQSLRETDPEKRLFPNDFLQLMDAGEQTSTINKVCIKISDQYTREVDSSVTALVKWVEPLAILIAGVFVLWFAFGIFSAVLKITETVQ
jgi:type IV pilus assembly protein PilC